VREAFLLVNYSSQKDKKIKSKKDKKRAVRVLSQNLLTDCLLVLRQRKAQNENFAFSERHKKDEN